MSGPWYVRSAATGTGDGLSWTNAKTTFAAAATAASAGDTGYIADDHAENGSANTTITLPEGSKWFCMDHTVASPGDANRKTTATVSLTGAFGITLTGAGYVEGVTFNNGNSGSPNSLTVSPTGTSRIIKLNACQLSVPATATGSIVLGNTATGVVELNNTPLKFSSASQGVKIEGRVKWENTASGIQGTVPTTLFSTFCVGGIEINGVDLSALGSGHTISGAFGTGPMEAFINDCLLGSGVTIAAAPTVAGCNTYVTRSDSGATTTRDDTQKLRGAQVADTTIVRTGGASDGTTAKSWKVTPNANANGIFPYQALVCAVWNDTVGSAINVGMEGIWNQNRLPNNNEWWIDVQHLGNTSYPLASFASGGTSSILATGAALTASASAWDSQVAARANNNVQAVGDHCKVASNPGRVFEVTAITSDAKTAGSEPAGFASATDGTSVTDNHVTWIAMTRFKQSLSVTPQLKGDIYVYAKSATNVAPAWLDPFIETP